MGYSINTEGHVHNGDGKLLGVFEDSTGVFTYSDAECKRYQGAVGRFIKNMGKSITSWELPGDERSPISKEDIPDQPKWHPMHGDKTPKYVRWLERYHLDQFKARYGVVKRGTVPMVDEQGNITGQKETWIARRKTCLTDVADLPGNMDPDLYSNEPI